MFNFTIYQGNADQNDNEISSHTCWNGYCIFKNSKDNSNIGKAVEILDSCTLSVGVQTGMTTMVNNMEVSEKNAKHFLLLDSQNRKKESSMVVDKRKRREKPVKIEQRKV